MRVEKRNDMKTSLIATLLALAVIGISAGSFAGPVFRPQAQPVQVRVAVDGFTSTMSLEQLQQDLAKLPGVQEVQVTLAPAEVSAKLDEASISVSRFVNTIAGYKTAMDARQTCGAHLLVYVDMQGCANRTAMCAQGKTEIPRRLSTMRGINSVTLDASGKIARITFLADAGIKTSDIARVLNASAQHFAVSFASPAQASEVALHQYHKQSVPCS